MQEDFRLRIFVTVASLKSFSKAAAHLHISQPSVSQNVSELERQLGQKLFDRQYGVTVLTPAGKVFHKYACRLLADYAEIASLFSPLAENIVRISACEEVYDYLTTVLLSDFSAVHPEISFVKSFEQDADLNVSLKHDGNKKGTFALSVSPSSYFTSTELWKVLSYLFASLL